jgi:hypothetical protein
VTTPIAGVPADLERPDFFPGQRLGAADFDAVATWQRELRWLHNRALHGWGIVSGLVVTGARRAREVTVTPGFGLDCEGREVILPDPAVLQVPPVASAVDGSARRYFLTASWQSDDALRVVESREGECLPGGATRRAETALLRFLDPLVLMPPERRYRPGLDLILATVDVRDCALERDAAGEGRRMIEPARRPRIWAGITPALATPWQYSAAAGRAIEVAVDTSGAGFGVTPTYLIQLVGYREVDGEPVDGWPEVLQASATRFLARVSLPGGLQVGGRALNPDLLFLPARRARTLDQLSRVCSWQISWVGLEP